jgi:hypothetical protein
MNDIDAKIAEHLFGYKVVGKGHWHEHGEGPIMAKVGEPAYYSGFLMLDVCMCKDFDAEKFTSAGDMMHGHHRWCLTPVPEYSTYHGLVGMILEALGKKGFDVRIRCLSSAVYKTYFVNIGQVEINEETLPLALCKAALLALGVK